MKLRHVFSTRDVAHARRVVELLRQHGLADSDVLLVARPDLELRGIPNRLKEADTDLVPAAIRGIGIGAVVGLLAGVVAIPFASPGVAGVAGLGAIGALVGGLSSALVGAALPDPVRQRFGDEIAAGRVLVLVDADERTHTQLGQLLADAGAIRLQYEAHTALS